MSMAESRSSARAAQSGFLCQSISLGSPFPRCVTRLAPRAAIFATCSEVAIWWPSETAMPSSRATSKKSAASGSSAASAAIVMRRICPFASACQCHRRAESATGMTCSSGWQPRAPGAAEMKGPSMWTPSTRRRMAMVARWFPTGPCPKITSARMGRTCSYVARREVMTVGRKATQPLSSRTRQHASWQAFRSRFRSLKLTPLYPFT